MMCYINPRTFTLLTWFGPVERKEDIDFMKHYTTTDTDETRQTGRPRKTWRNDVKEIMKL